LCINDRGTSDPVNYNMDGSYVYVGGVPRVCWESIEGLFLKAGTGNDVINFTLDTTSPHPAEITFEGGPGFDTLSVTITPGGSFGVTDTSISADGLSIHYFEIESLVFTIGGGSNIINVLGTAQGTATTINAGGGGSNIINVLGMAQGTATTINAG